MKGENNIMEITKKFETSSDIEVIGRILQGEVSAFEILIRKNNPVLYKTGRSYGYCHEDVEDLMQETFISAYQSLAKFENRSSFKTWIIKIMLNKCFQKQQKFSFKNELVTYNGINDNSVPMYSSSSQSDTDKAVTNRELNRVIENALQHVPPDYRMVFSLREIAGLNVAETMDVLKITESNVKVRLNRAKAMLRNEIEKSYSAEDIYEFNLIYCDLIVSRVMNEIKLLDKN